MGNGCKGHILVVDDSVTNLKLAEQTLKPYYKVTLLVSGEQTLKFLSKNKPDLILLDIKMPGMDGFETIKAIKDNEFTKDIPVIFLTAISESASELKGLKMGAIDFIAKPFVPEVMLRRVSMQIELKNYRDNMEKLVREKTKMVEQLQDVIVLSITDLVEFRDKITGGHARRTANYLKILLDHLRTKPQYQNYLDDEMVTNMLRAAPLHDVGKIGINDDILTNTGILNDAEFEYMKKHTTLGALAFEKASEEIPGNKFLGVAKDMALSHHERWNGAGYPYGLKGVTTKRSYKEPMSHEDALKLMTDLRGTHFQPELIDEFIECEKEFYEENIRMKNNDDE